MLPTQLRTLTCECGHSADEHACGYICTHKLDTFPDGGWHGVCPCVRYSERPDGTLKPNPLRRSVR